MNIRMNSTKFQVLHQGSIVGDLSFPGIGMKPVVHAPLKVILIIDRVWRRVSEEGVRQMGDVVSDLPVRLDRAYWLPYFWTELEGMGIGLRPMQEDGSAS